MTPELQAKLQACNNLPSPPGVATKIVDLANDPNADMNTISNVIALDPAITSKILRVANSPMYAQRSTVETLRKALIVLGLNATVSLALSFSLLKSWQSKQDSDGLDYELFWRRALLSATAARILAPVAGVQDAEELFLNALIQDIGMLALTRAVEDLYIDTADLQLHQERLIRHERSKIGTDHAAAGGWLLKRWSFPNRLEQGVAASHSPDRVPKIHENGKFVRCVALSGLFAEVYLNSKGERHFKELAAGALKLLGINKDQLADLMEVMNEQIPTIESVFETKLIDTSSETILEEAREVLMLRSLRTLQVVDDLHDKAAHLETRTKELEESSQRDALTGLYNRGYLDEFLANAFKVADQRGEPLSVAFADLDHFKSVNDTHGHQVGDQLLVSVAKMLEKNTRSADLVARYGGEEFILVFPGTDKALVAMICERIVKAIAAETYDFVEDGLSVTISIGYATHGETMSFGSIDEFVHAADTALYTAKMEGRNRSVEFQKAS
jgi:diguanylate cyclase (GGDEF)-like protein